MWKNGGCDAVDPDVQRNGARREGVAADQNSGDRGVHTPTCSAQKSARGSRQGPTGNRVDTSLPELDGDLMSNQMGQQTLVTRTRTLVTRILGLGMQTLVTRRKLFSVAPII